MEASQETKRSAFNQGEHVLLSHNDVHFEVVIHGVVELFLCKTLLKDALLKERVVHTQSVHIFAHFLQNFKDPRPVVVHGFAFFCVLNDASMGFFHKFKTFCNVVFGNLVGESESGLNKKIITLAWQSLMRAKRLRVVTYLSLSRSFRPPICSWRC
jgi:hypothetical protein